MEKNIHFFYEGQSVTPIMQKFDDLKCAIARYNRVTAQSEKPKIAFAYGIITFIYDAIDALECYQADLDKCECRDALALAFMELADKGFWLKDDRLRQEMHAFADKPLDSYGVTLGLNGVVYQDTLHIYRVIEEGIERMVALLKQVEATLKAAPPELYQNFYRNLRAQYCEEQAVKDFGDWLMHSGKISLCKLKSFRAQAIADYVNSGILRCALEPSEEERSQVDVDEFKSQLPCSYPYEEWFDDCYAVFCRTVSWEGHILVPDYCCAGLFIFQNWDKLTEKDIQTIFHLDKMLELIHEEIKKLPQEENKTEELSVTLPMALATPEAMILWKKAQDAGYVDEHYQPLLSRTEAALLANAIAEKLGIKEKWKVFEAIWSRNNMRNDYNDALNQQKTRKILEHLKKTFSD